MLQNVFLLFLEDRCLCLKWKVLYMAHTLTRSYVWDRCSCLEKYILFENILLVTFKATYIARTGIPSLIYWLHKYHTTVYLDVVDTLISQCFKLPATYVHITIMHFSFFPFGIKISCLLHCTVYA